MSDIGLGENLEEIFRRQMGAAANAGGAQIDRLPPFGLRQKIGEGLDGGLGVRSERLRRGDRQGDGRQALRGEALGLVERVVDRQRCGRHQDRVAIRRGDGHMARGDIAARALHVLRDDLLAQALAEPGADDARDAIGEAPGGIADDQRNTLGGPGFLRLRWRQREAANRHEIQTHRAQKADFC